MWFKWVDARFITLLRNTYIFQALLEKVSKMDKLVLFFIYMEKNLSILSIHFNSEKGTECNNNFLLSSWQIFEVKLCKLYLERKKKKKDFDQRAGTTSVKILRGLEMERRGRKQKKGKKRKILRINITCTFKRRKKFYDRNHQANQNFNDRTINLAMGKNHR